MKPLLTSKVRLPVPRAGTITRGRLAERLTAESGSSLTVLSAPAGFGKTTLLTNWLAEAAAGGTAVAWLSVDRQDSDPARFWTYVATAVQTAVPGLGDSALRLLSASPSSTDAAVAALLNDLENLTGELILALDDYHLIDAPQVHEAMAFLLEHRPPLLRLVLATRADPPLPLAQLRARGELTEVRAGELRFTLAETADYLNQSMGLGLGEADLAALEGRTEGWIAALQLAALSLQGRSDPSDFISGFAGDDRYLVDYLTDEVLARLPAEVRGFLIQTSILDSLTGALCDAVTAGDGGKAMLVALERANLFLVPLDDRRQWYRYHHLFAEVLHAHLLDERPDEVAELHRRASGWFEAHDSTGLAVSHAQAGGDIDRAAGLMELAMPAMFRERRETELARWVRSLPDEVVRARPVLGVAIVGALAQASAFGDIGERLDDIEHRVSAGDGRWPETPPEGVIVVDLDGFRSLPARIQMYRAALALASGDLPGTIEHARAALDRSPADDALTRAAAGALGGLALWTTGDLAGAHAAYTESVAGLAAVGFLADVLGCTITLADLERTQGRLTAAVRTYQHALDSTALVPGAAPVRGTADMHVGLAAVLLERGDLAAAREQLAISENLGAANGLPQNRYRSLAVRARLCSADGDLDQALALLDEADRVYVGDYAPNVQPVPAVRARLQLRRGELADVAEWARDRGLSVADQPSYRREYEHLTLARLLIALHRAEPAESDPFRTVAFLDRLRDDASAGGRQAPVIEIHLLQALTYHLARDLPAALTALERAVALAQPEGYLRLFADEGRPLAALMRLLRRHTRNPGYLDRLLSATVGTPSPVSAQPLIDPLSERELEVLRLLGSDLGGPDIARELHVSLNTLRTHTKNIYAKLGVTNRRAAVGHAHELDLIRVRRPG